MSDGRELSSSELIQVRALASSACHPRHIDEYLAGREFSESDIDSALESLGLSRSQIRRDYRSKQRCIAFAVIALISTVVAAIWPSIGTVAIAIVAFGGLLVTSRPLRYRKSQQQAGWLHRRRFTPR